MKLNKIENSLVTYHDQARYLKHNDYSNNMEVITRLRERKDHFVVTIYKHYRKKQSISIGNIVTIKIGNEEIIRPIRKDYHISLPKNLLKNNEKNDKITLNITSISRKDDCIKRPRKMVKDNKLDIRHFIPLKTINGYPIYIIDRDKEIFSIWYPIGGGAKHITIKNFISINKISELLGFYFGDGSTSKSIRSFRLTNSEPSVLSYCLNILHKIGIKDNVPKVQLIYSTNNELTKEIKRRCINFWSKKLKINRNKIVSVNKANNIRETLEYGSARIYIDNSTLVEVMLHGLIRGILPRIIDPKNKYDQGLLRGFMRGLLAAEGGVNVNYLGFRSELNPRRQGLCCIA